MWVEVDVVVVGCVLMVDDVGILFFLLVMLKEVMCLYLFVVVLLM